MSEVYFAPVQLNLLREGVTAVGGRNATATIKKLVATSGQGHVVEQIAARDGDRETITVEEIDAWSRAQLGLAKDVFAIGWLDFSKGDESEQLAALGMLAANGTPEALALLEQIVADPGFSLPVDRSSVATLVQVAARSTSEKVKTTIAGMVLPHLIEQMGSVISRDAYQAVDLLLKLEGVALPQLTSILVNAKFPLSEGADSNNRVIKALVAVGRLGQVGAPLLALIKEKILPAALAASRNGQLLGDNWQVARQAINALGRISGDRTGDVLPLLFELTTLDNQASHGLATEAHMAILDLASSNLSLLRPYLTSSNRAYRQSCRVMLLTNFQTYSSDRRLAVIEQALRDATDPKIIAELRDLQQRIAD